jgi:hypothetical protein
MSSRYVYIPLPYTLDDTCPRSNRTHLLTHLDDQTRPSQEVTITPSCYSDARSLIFSRFRCKVGGEWLPLDAFSTNQQKAMFKQIDRGSKIDPAMCGMTCRQHSPQQAQTIRCDQCKLYKPRDEYSKTSLREDTIVLPVCSIWFAPPLTAHQKCKQCVAWIETQEPGMTPAPLATGHISPEEIEHSEQWEERVNPQVL